MAKAKPQHPLARQYRILSHRAARLTRWVCGVGDSPHRLALGVAIGIFFTMLPMIGLQSLFVLVFAWLLRANKTIGLPLVWISNPATIVPIYYPCYRLGVWITGAEPVSLLWWKKLASPPAEQSAMRFYWESLSQISVPLAVGCTIVAVIAAVISYVGSRWLIVRLRLATAGRRAARRRQRENEAIQKMLEQSVRVAQIPTPERATDAKNG